MKYVPSRPHSSKPSALVTYLNCPDNWRSPSLPSLSDDTRLRRARNSKKNTQDNNDLLEFIGDRVVNLACALMVEKVKYSSDHQMWVGRVISNNDTLGRLSYQLELNEHARLDLLDIIQVKDWNPQCCDSPPKPLADLFEAFTGAVYEEKGWNVTFQWLQNLYKPLITAATKDFHNSAPSIPAHWHAPPMVPEDSYCQEMLLDYLSHKGEFLASSAQEALDALPLSSIFIFASNGGLGNDCDKVEVADHLIRYWICSIFVQLNPEMQQATAKAAHLVTWITKAVVSEWSLGYIGSLLTLSSYFEETDPDYNSNRALSPTRYLDASTRGREIVYRTKLSFVFKAVIGWYYLKDPRRAEKWGIAWFKFMVIRAHDLIVKDRRYQPSILPSDAVPTVSGLLLSLESDATTELGPSVRSSGETKSTIKHSRTTASRSTADASSLIHALEDLGIKGPPDLDPSVATSGPDTAKDT